MITVFMEQELDKPNSVLSVIGLFVFMEQELDKPNSVLSVIGL